MVVGQLLITPTVEICVQQLGQVKEMVWLQYDAIYTEYLACAEPWASASRGSVSGSRNSCYFLFVGENSRFYFTDFYCIPERIRNNCGQSYHRTFMWAYMYASITHQVQRCYSAFRDSGCNEWYSVEEWMSQSYYSDRVLIYSAIANHRHQLTERFYQPCFSVTGQLADTPTRGSSSRVLVNSRMSLLYQ